MSPIVIGLLILILLIGIPISIPIALSKMNKAWAKRIAKEILGEGQIRNLSNYWKAVNTLNKMQKHDLEAGDLLKSLQQLKESQEAK